LKKLQKRASACQCQRRQKYACSWRVGPLVEIELAEHVDTTMYTKQCDCLKNCLCLAIRFGQFGQTMGTGHYYFDEIVWNYFLFWRAGRITARMPVSSTISQSGFQERARARVVVVVASRNFFLVLYCCRRWPA
jgi:hypothetical protein